MVTVGIIMGSKSDWETMKPCSDLLTELGIAHDTQVVSAHRTPDLLASYGKSARDKGLQVIIAGAGGAAHLPGMMASKTRIPVLGVPVQTKILSGVDSLYSIVQMPKGIPVGTVAIGENGAFNAGLLSASIIALFDSKVKKNLEILLILQDYSPEESDNYIVTWEFYIHNIVQDEYIDSKFFSSSDMAINYFLSKIKYTT